MSVQKLEMKDEDHDEFWTIQKIFPLWKLQLHRLVSQVSFLQSKKDANISIEQKRASLLRSSILLYVFISSENIDCKLLHSLSVILLPQILSGKSSSHLFRQLRLLRKVILRKTIGTQFIIIVVRCILVVVFSFMPILMSNFQRPCFVYEYWIGLNLVRSDIFRSHPSWTIQHITVPDQLSGISSDFFYVHLGAL